MLKIIILLLVVLIVYFIFRTKKGMNKIDKIFTKENSENMEKIKLEIQKKLDENKTKRRK